MSFFCFSKEITKIKGRRPFFSPLNLNGGEQMYSTKIKSINLSANPSVGCHLFFNLCLGLWSLTSGGCHHCCAGITKCVKELEEVSNTSTHLVAKDFYKTIAHLHFEYWCRKCVFPPERPELSPIVGPTMHPPLMSLGANPHLVARINNALLIYN